MELHGKQVPSLLLTLHDTNFLSGTLSQQLTQFNYPHPDFPAPRLFPGPQAALRKMETSPGSPALREGGRTWKHVNKMEFFGEPVNLASTELLLFLSLPIRFRQTAL